MGDAGLLKYHGKPGAGASVRCSIKQGLITMLSFEVEADGKFECVLAKDKSACGPIPPTGNTNMHGRFQHDVRTFPKRWVTEGLTHHFALGIGDRAATIAKLAAVLGIECAVVSGYSQKECTL